MILINKPIEVVTLHEPGGQMTPLRFRIMGEDGKAVYELKVKTIDKDKTKIVYRCITQINGQQREVELCYMIMETKWLLANMR